MINGMVTAMLAVETVSDLRTKSVSAIRLIIFLAAAAAVNIVMRYQPVWSMLGGMAVGAVLFVYAAATREGIGYGDCLVFVCSGAYLGLYDNVMLLFFSLLAAAVTGVVMKLVRQKGAKRQIPFVPCILGTYAVMTIIKAVS